MPASDSPPPTGERLNKVLARAGVVSRRGADELIRQGRVTVNGTVTTELGTRVDPARDAIKVDGRRVAQAPKVPVFYALYKPDGYVTTMSDPEGRPTVADLLKGVRRGVFPVGRLDFHTEGLLLLTDDGELGRDLAHPRKGVPRTYRAKLKGRPVQETLDRLQRGIMLEGRATGPIEVRVVRPARNTWCEITVREGRKHFVRKLFLAVGHPVLRLRRIAFGGVSLGDLASGRLRALSDDEVATLRRAVAGVPGKPAAPPGRRGGAKSPARAKKELSGTKAGPGGRPRSSTAGSSGTGRKSAARARREAPRGSRSSGGPRGATGKRRGPRN